MHNEFVECDTCRAKPGSPSLCAGCLHNRDTIHRLTGETNIISPTIHLIRLPAWEALERARAIVSRAERAIHERMNDGYREKYAGRIAQVYWDEPMPMSYGGYRYGR